MCIARAAIFLKPQRGDMCIEYQRPKSLKPQRGDMCRIGLIHDKSRKTIFRSSGAQCGGGTSIHAIAQVQLTD